MPDPPSEPPSTGPIDTEILDRIAAHLARSARFDDVQSRPPYAPNAVVADYDLGYFPNGIVRAYLRIRWFETDDFSIHYLIPSENVIDWRAHFDHVLIGDLDEDDLPRLQKRGSSWKGWEPDMDGITTREPTTALQVMC